MFVVIKLLFLSFPLTCSLSRHFSLPFLFSSLYFLSLFPLPFAFLPTSLSPLFLSFPFSLPCFPFPSSPLSLLSPNNLGGKGVGRLFFDTPWLFQKFKMKLNKFVSSDRSKSRKRHFTAPSHIRRKLMSAPLSKVTYVFLAPLSISLGVSRSLSLFLFLSLPLSKRYKYSWSFF